MTHAEMVELAAIGWRWHAQPRSVLVEAKATRADALRERHKSARTIASNLGRGLGQQRYLLLPLDCLTPQEIAEPTSCAWLPEGWGLLVSAPRGMAPKGHQVQRRVRLAGAEYGVWTLLASHPHDPGREEIAFLLSAVRRMPPGPGVRCRVYRIEGPSDVAARATIGIDEEGQ